MKCHIIRHLILIFSAVVITNKVCIHLKSVSHQVEKKFKAVEDIVHSRDFVVIVAFLEKLYNKSTVDY